MNISITKKGKRRAGFYFDLPEQEEGYGYPSVTTILKVLAKPELDYWKAKLVATKTLETESIEQGISAPRVVMETAGGEGSVAHNIIDDYFKGHAYNKEYNSTYSVEKDGIDGEKINKYLTAFEVFLNEFKPVVVETEGTVYSHTEKFAGTYDGIFEVNGKKWLIDWKTSNGIYWDHRVQIIAYKNALKEMGIEVDECVIVQLKNSGKPVVEYVGEEENGVNLYEAFKCAKFLYNTKEIIK